MLNWFRFGVCFGLQWIDHFVCVDSVFNWFTKKSSENINYRRCRHRCRRRHEIAYMSNRHPNNVYGNRINSQQIIDFNSIRLCVANRSVRFCDIDFVHKNKNEFLSDEPNTVLSSPNIHLRVANGYLLHVFGQRVCLSSSHSVQTVCIANRSMSHSTGQWYSLFQRIIYWRMHIAHPNSLLIQFEAKSIGARFRRDYLSSQMRNETKNRQTIITRRTSSPE